MESWLKAFDAIARRRPGLAMAALIALGAAVAILLLAQAQGPVILYQEF
jgi:hypothetical protein